MSGLLENHYLTAGESIDKGIGFLVRGLRVDNPSGTWYIVKPFGYIIPPLTLNWQSDLSQGTTRLQLEPITFLGQTNFSDASDELIITAYDDAIGNNPGAPAIHLDTRSYIASATEGTTLTLTPPFHAIGLRIDNPGGTAYTIGSTGIIVPPWTIGFTVDILPPFTTLALTPIANPTGQSNTTRGGPLSIVAYAELIGNSPGVVISGIPSDLYTTQAIIAPVISGITRFFVIDSITTGKRVRLNSLLFDSPGVAQKYQIYTVTPGSLSGTLDVVEAVTPLDPASPAFPGVVSAQGNTVVLPVPFRAATQNSSNANSANGSIVLPAGLQNGDALFLAIAVATTTITVNAISGWTQRSTITQTGVGRLTVFQKNAVTPADSGATVNFTLSVASTNGYVAGAMAYGQTPTFGVAATAVSSGVASCTFGALTGGTLYQGTVEFGCFTVAATVSVDPHTPRQQVTNSTLRLVCDDDFAQSGGNTASYTPAAITLSGITSTMSIDLNFTVPATMTFTLGTLLGTTITIPTGTQTSVDVRALIGDVFITSTQALGIVEPANTTMTLTAILEVV